MTKKYSYKELRLLKAEEEKVNVWAVIRFLTYSKDYKIVKLMLLDEGETPIFCELRMGQSDNFGDLALSSEMIIRIHRCKVRIACNKQLTIVGTINQAGLHVAAWCVDDINYPTKFRSSVEFTFDCQTDAIRVDELRKFWKRRILDDGAIRRVFFEMATLNSLFTNRAEQEIVEDPEPAANSNNFANSFDEFTRQGHAQPQPQNHIDKEFGEQFLEGLRTTIQQITKEMPQLVKTIPFSKVQLNSYFNIVCQILAVHVPYCELDNKKEKVCLSVCDGTMLGIPGNFYSVGCTHLIQSQLFTDERNYDPIKKFVYLIGCWDSYAEQARKLQAGDIVIIMNAKADGPKQQDGLYYISLYGDTAKNAMYRRGIECLRKYAKDEIEEDGEHEGTDEARCGKPAEKKARRECWWVNGEGASIGQLGTK